MLLLYAYVYVCVCVCVCVCVLCECNLKNIVCEENVVSYKGMLHESGCMDKDRKPGNGAGEIL